MFGAFPRSSIEQANRSQIVTIATDNGITGTEVWLGANFFLDSKVVLTRNYIG